jgi:hypothetical protein
MRNPIHVKGVDDDIQGNGLVELHMAYQNGHTRQIHVRAANAPDMSPARRAKHNLLGASAQAAKHQLPLPRYRTTRSE